MKSFLKISLVLVSVFVMEYCFLLAIARSEETAQSNRQKLLKIIPGDIVRSFALRDEKSQTKLQGTWRVVHDASKGSYDFIEIAIEKDIFMTAVTLGKDTKFARFFTKGGILAEIFFHKNVAPLVLPLSMTEELSEMYSNFTQKVVEGAIRGLKIESDDDLNIYILKEIKKATES